MTWLPEWATSQAAGWLVAVSQLLTFGLLFATGVVTSGRTSDMWKSAYEKLREADDLRRNGQDEVQQAKDATMIHLLESLQAQADRGGDDDVR